MSSRPTTRLGPIEFDRFSHPPLDVSGGSRTTTHEVIDAPDVTDHLVEVARQRVEIDVSGVEPLDDRYLLTVSALVDADIDLLRLLGDVLADAEFLGQSARRADFRHYTLWLLNACY